jgi:hypothetical protein
VVSRGGLRERTYRIIRGVAILVFDQEQIEGIEGDFEPIVKAGPRYEMVGVGLN